METSYTLCVMCCCSFSNNLSSSSNEDESSHASKQKKEKHNLAEFYNLLKECSPPPPPSREPVSSTNNEEEDEGLLESKQLSVCTQCGDFVKTALKSRSTAGKLEVTVMKLQLELLNKMRELASQMDTFYEDMSRIEGVIKGSDESCLQYHLQNQEEVSSEDGKRRVIRMRTTFLDAVKDLRSFKSTISRKFGSGEQDQEDAEDASEILKDAELGNIVKMEVDDLNYFLDETEEDTSIFPFNNEQELLSSDEESHDSASDAEEDNNVTRGSGRGKMKIKVIIKKKPKVNVQMSRSGKRKFIFTDEDQLKLELMGAMSPYKRMVVRRAFKREKYKVTEEPCNDHLMHYDFQQDKLLVGSVQVLIHEKEQTLTCSECNLTGKPPTKGNIKEQCGLEKRLKEHIVGSHLGGYQCPLCDQVRTSRTMYLEHMREAHKGVQVKKQRKLDSLPKPHKCTICDYSTNKPCDLRRHLKTHEQKGKVNKNRTKKSVARSRVVKQEVRSDEEL